ncbi:peroxiredoxin family protein [Candidatus Hydrogenedentota bacterium]
MGRFWTGTKLQNKHSAEGSVIVGISTEDSETVQSFVNEMGDKMDYAVAVDSYGQAYQAYVGAFGLNGIPHAFLVDKSGKIVWHGHPVDRLDEVVANLISGEVTVKKDADKGEKSGGCSVSSMTMGKVPSRNLQDIRQLRDENLIMTPLGRTAVRGYYWNRL